MNRIKTGSEKFQGMMKWGFYVLVIAAHIFMLRNIILLGGDMLNGDKSAKQMIPLPVYSFMRVPITPLTQTYHAEKRLAADFASLYFPAQRMDILQKHYKNNNLDLWNRPSNKAPLIYYLCSISICKLSYGPASLVFVIFQYLLFMTVFIFSFRLLKIEKYIWLGILLVNLYLFLTPTGLSNVERGQSYLFVASAYLLLLTGFIKKNTLLILLAALPAFVRWTSLPFMVLGFAIYLFNSKTFSEVRQKILVGVGFGLVMFLLTFSFRSLGLLFLKQLLTSEGAQPGGISLATILPGPFKYILLVVLLILAILTAVINKRVFEQNIPFITGSGIIILTYPTQPNEYSLASVLVFIPLLLYWMEQDSPYAGVFQRQIIVYIFLGFLFLASLSHLVVSPGSVIYEYILAAAILFILPLFYIWRSRALPEFPQPKAVS